MAAVPKLRTVRSGEDSDGPFVAISLATGKRPPAEVLVDPADAEWARAFFWQLGTDGYAYRQRSWSEPVRGSVAMHRELLGLEKGDGRQGDHRNRDKLDCRRGNLRVADNALNRQNQPSTRKNAKSKYRGVSRYAPHGKRYPGCGWRARVQVAGKVKYGYFATEEEAAKAAAQWRQELMPFTTN